MPKVWFFDLDGTLADTDCDIRLAWKKSLADLGLVCADFDARFVAGPPIDEMVKTLFPAEYAARGVELCAAARARFGANYDTGGFPNTREYPGVLDAVRRLKAAGARVYVATNKRWAGTRLIADKFGWWSLFDGLYAGDMYRDDPAVGILRKSALLAKILREIGATGAEAVMVGDTASDFEAAAANGMQSIGVTWGYGTPAELALATRLVSSPAELA